MCELSILRVSHCSCTDSFGFMCSYCKKHLKNWTTEFIAVIRRTMGVHLVALLTYELNDEQKTAM